jgi:hypothetical protein
MLLVYRNQDRREKAKFPGWGLANIRTWATEGGLVRT